MFIVVPDHVEAALNVAQQRLALRAAALRDRAELKTKENPEEKKERESFVMFLF